MVLRMSMIILFCLLLLGSVNASEQEELAMSNEQVPVATLKAFLTAFNHHDLDAIMEFFAEDCELYMPKGPDPWGMRYVGKADVRKGLASRFTGVPDVHYGEDRHWVAGSRGVSEWLLTGTLPSGQPIRVRGVDLLDFRNGKIVRKDSYWKIVDVHTHD